MAKAIIDTAAGYGNIEPKRITVDMSKELGFLEPSANPLVVITKRIGTQACHNPKYEWMDNDLEVREVTIKSPALKDATSIELGAGMGANVAVGDLLKFATTGEILRVTAVVTDTITVVRNIGSAAAEASALGSTDKLLVVGNASMQGSGAPSENIVGVTPHYNYTQIFKTPFSITNTLDATTLYGMKELARLRKNAGIKHAKSIEYAFLFGAKSIDTSGAQPLTTTEGVFTTLAKCPNNAEIPKATGTEADILAFCEKVFRYGGSERTCLCSPDVLSWITNKAIAKLQIMQSDKDKTYGLNITRIMTPFGILNLVLHPLLTGVYSGKMLVLDMGEVKYRPLNGRDTKLMTNIQAPDEDGERDQYITEGGIQLRMPLKHGIVTFK